MKEVLQIPAVRQATAAAVAADTAEAAQEAVADTAVAEHPEAAARLEEEDKETIKTDIQ